MTDWLQVLQLATLAGVAVTAPAVVATREPFLQAIGVGFYGLLFALLFFVYRAPDVALSQLVVSAVALPLMICLALAKMQRRRKRAEEHAWADT